MTTTRYWFPRSFVDVDDGANLVVSNFYDGTTVTATPNHDPDSIARAWDLGYEGNTWAMSRDHELTHHLLAEPDASPVMWALAHRRSLAPLATDDEEAAVLAYQAALDKSTTARPWDDHRQTRPPVTWGSLHCPPPVVHDSRIRGIRDRRKDPLMLWTLVVIIVVVVIAVLVIRALTGR